MCVRSHRQAKRSRQAKVGELQRIALSVDQKVLRFQVPMQDPACKHCCQPKQADMNPHVARPHVVVMEVAPVQQSGPAECCVSAED